DREWAGAAAPSAARRARHGRRKRDDLMGTPIRAERTTIHTRIGHKQIPASHDGPRRRTGARGTIGASGGRRIISFLRKVPPRIAMTHVVTESCIKCKYTDCVDVCPVDCFREGPNMLAIDPDECIDCAV